MSGRKGLNVKVESIDPNAPHIQINQYFPDFGRSINFDQEIISSSFSNSCYFIQTQTLLNIRRLFGKVKID